MNIIIPIKRNRFPVVLVISILLTILLTFNLIYTKTEDVYMNGLFNLIFNSVILAVPSFYTIISLTEFLKTKFDKNAMLKITDIGLDDNLSIFSCDKILWTDIISAEITKTFKADFLVIKLNDNQKYLAGKNFIQRIVLKKWIKKWGSPIIISEKRVEYNLTNLKQIILTHIAK